MALKLTREQIDNSDELNLAIGCIVSDVFLEELNNILSRNLQLIKAQGVKTIIRWCLDHYKIHTNAPKELIQDIFISQQPGMQDEVIESVGTILTNLNDRYLQNEQAFSERYYLAKSKDYLEKESLLRLAQEMTGAITLGKVEEAKRLLVNFNKVDKVISTGVDPFTDRALVVKMFESLTTGILKFPYDALQQMFHQVYRKDVISVAGKAKAGKSFVMQQLALYGLYSGLNVAMFSFEMGVEIMGMRLFQNLLGESRHSMEAEVRIPYFDKNNNILYDTLIKPGLEMSEVIQFQNAFKTYMGNGQLRFFDSDSCGRKVSNIVDALNRLEKYEDFKVDMVVIDYDSLLENEHGFNGSTYEGINEIWKDVKNKIALDLNTLVVFGSQLNKDGAKGEVTPLNASHSSRKFDWVSVWISLVATEAERTNGLARLTALGRHHDFSGDEVVITQALSLARPILDARWKKDIPGYDDFVDSLSNDHKAKQPKKKQEEEDKDWRV